MASLYSANKHDFITISPLSIDDEGWITVQAKLYRNKELIAKGVEPYLSEGEILHLLQDFKKLVNDEINQLESLFMEPNLNIRIDRVNEDQYLVEFVFKLYWEEEEIDESVKRLKFNTNKHEIESFLAELNSEHNKVKKVD